MNTKSKQKANKQSSIKQKNSTRCSTELKRHHTRSIQHQQKQQKLQSKKHTQDRHQQYINLVYLRDDQQLQEESVVVQTKTINTKYRRSKRIRNSNQTKSKQIFKRKSKKKQVQVIENEISSNEESIEEYNPVNERKKKRKTRNIKKNPRPHSRLITRNSRNQPQRELLIQQSQNPIIMQPRELQNLGFQRILLNQNINRSDSSVLASIPLQNNNLQLQTFNNVIFDQQIDSQYESIVYQISSPRPILQNSNFEWFISKNKIFKSVQLTIQQLQKCDQCIICFESFIKQEQQKQQKLQKQQKEQKQQTKLKQQIKNQKQQQKIQKIELLELFCSHFYHKQCIQGWLKGKDRPHCPCCRKDFRKHQQYQKWDKNYKKRISSNEIIQFNEMNNLNHYNNWVEYIRPLFSQFRPQPFPSISRQPEFIVIQDSEMIESIGYDRINRLSGREQLRMPIQRDNMIDYDWREDQVEQIQMQNRGQRLYEYILQGWDDNQHEQNNIVSNQNNQNNN